MPIPRSDLPSGDIEHGTSTSPVHAGDPGRVLTESKSTAFREALSLLQLYARSSKPLVIEGESGTGKTVLARQVHAWSPRAHRTFESVSLANVGKSFATAELFGQVPGAYTGANYARTGKFRLANGGTLFLDELGHSSRHVQGQLLEVIETGRVRPMGSDDVRYSNVHLIFATSVPMNDLVERGDLLYDLYARIQMLTVQLPPLRERPEDIPGLAQYFLERHAPAHGYAKPPKFARDVVRTLCRAGWPLNVRGLESAVEALLMHAYPARTITREHFKSMRLRDVLASAARPRKRPKSDEVVRVYRAVDKNVSRTGDVLGIERGTVRSHLARSAVRDAEPRSG